jgi:hypothetical protein
MGFHAQWYRGKKVCPLNMAIEQFVETKRKKKYAH